MNLDLNKLNIGVEDYINNSISGGEGSIISSGVIELGAGENSFKIDVSSKFKIEDVNLLVEISPHEENLETIVKDLLGPEYIRKLTHKLMVCLGRCYSFQCQNNESEIINISNISVDSKIEINKNSIEDRIEFEGLMVHRDIFKKLKKDKVNLDIPVIRASKDISDLYFRDAAGRYISYFFEKGAIKYSNLSVESKITYEESPLIRINMDNDGKSLVSSISMDIGLKGAEFIGKSCRNLDLLNSENWNISNDLGVHFMVTDSI